MYTRIKTITLLSSINKQGERYIQPLEQESDEQKMSACNIKTLYETPISFN